MSEIVNFYKIDHLDRAFRANPKNFFKNHQHGNTILQWKKAGYPYQLIVKYGKQVKVYTGDLKLWVHIEKPEIPAFLMMVSIHNNTGWEKWTRKNSKNIVAVIALFEPLHMNYWRTRFRALYALHFMEQKMVKAELRKKKHQMLSAKTKEILKTMSLPIQ